MSPRIHARSQESASLQRWTVRVALAVAVIGLLSLPMSSHAATGMSARPTSTDRSATRLYWATGRDARDTPRHPLLDIVQSRRVAFVQGEHRWLGVTVRSRSSFRDSKGSDQGVSVALDTRGDERPDLRLIMYLGDAGSDDAPFCSLQSTRHSSIRRAAETLHLRRDGAMSCRVRLGALRATHHPRWRLLSWAGLVGGARLFAERYDHAPDRGWYP